MNGLSVAERGYLGTMETTRSTRRTEYEVVAQITRRLREAARHKKTKFPEFVEALDLNRKLWKAFAKDVANPGNSLPEDMRARIVYLAEFSDAHTSKVLRDGASILPLLEINVAIMRGLKPGGASS